MKKSVVVMLALIPLMSFTVGCKSVLPSEHSHAQSQWQSFEDAKENFNRIEPHKTTMAELKQIGYDPDATPNMKILTYSDVINRFLPNSSMKVEDLHEAVQTCVRDKDACRAYEVEMNVVKGKRVGSVCADMFGFRKRTHVTGWNFKGLIITKNDMVIYTLWSGQPALNKMDMKRKPLGPFQELDGVLYKAASAGAGF